jgi:hypothetical protein
MGYFMSSHPGYPTLAQINADLAALQADARALRNAKRRIRGGASPVWTLARLSPRLASEIVALRTAEPSYASRY